MVFVLCLVRKGQEIGFKGYLLPRSRQLVHIFMSDSNIIVVRDRLPTTYICYSQDSESKLLLSTRDCCLRVLLVVPILVGDMVVDFELWQHYRVHSVLGIDE